MTYPFFPPFRLRYPFHQPKPSNCNSLYVLLEKIGKRRRGKRVFKKTKEKERGDTLVIMNDGSSSMGSFAWRPYT